MPKRKKLWLLVQFKKITVPLIILILVSPNATFVDDVYWYDLKGMYIYSIGLSKAHISLGKALSEFSAYQYTMASADAGAIPYYSDWKHIDMYGLTDRYIAKKGYADLEYIYKNYPNLVILVSKDGTNPTPSTNQINFIKFVKKEKFVRLDPIKFKDDLYLLVYIDPKIHEFNKIYKTIEKVSQESFYTQKNKSPIFFSILKITNQY